MWTLVIFVYCLALGKNESNALLAVPSLSQKACLEAGQNAVRDFSVGMKQVKFMCIEQAK